MGGEASGIRRDPEALSRVVRGRSKDAGPHVDVLAVKWFTGGMTSPVLLALALAASTASPSSAAAERLPALDGCTVLEADGAALTMECPGARLFVRVREPGGADAYTRGILAGFKTTAPQPFEEGAVKVPLEGRSLPATRLRIGDGRVLLLATDAQPAATRVLGCQAMPGAEERCAALLATVVTMRLDDPRLGALPAPAPPTLAGRAVAAPKGCAVSAHAGAGAIQCREEKAILTWMADPAGSEGFLERFLETIAAELPFRSLDRATLPCAIEGLAATCRVLRNPTGEPLTIIGGEQVVRGTRLVVACMHARKAGELPEICQPALSLSAPAPTAAEPAAPAARPAAR